MIALAAACLVHRGLGSWQGYLLSSGVASFMTSKRLFAFAVLAICGLATGCGLGSGSGNVSEQAARTAYENLHSDIKKGKTKLISFHKINGRKGEAKGRRYYEVEYEAELEHLTDDPTGAIVGGIMLEGWKKGDVMKERDRLRFWETEKGWRGPDGNVY